ncbi:transcriptional regulator with XRE-family HTH domain [Elusimicrobium posterum]|uniref:helix-turn-helix domain-containing protein n=1 Tax=Elusimicrobium posterum TaxID=3116653 RepID=UPI003C72248B
MSDQIKEIAQRLKELRNIEDISAASLAKDLGLSTEVYEEYESGTKDIPVSILYRVAAKFNVELTALLTGEEPRLSVYSLTKKDRGISVTRRKEYDYKELAHNFKNKKAEFFLVTVEPKNIEKIEKAYAHSGHESMYITKGRILMNINDREVVLEEGDFIYFDSSAPHGMLALDGKQAQFLASIIN